MPDLPPVAILAGGLATRLRPLTESTPKSLLPVNGRPFIAHQLDLLNASGISRAVVCVGFLGQQIIDYVGDGRNFGIAVTYSCEGEHLLGTGGAIKRALPLLGDRFFVLYGDSYLPCDYAAVFRAFEESSRLALMTVFRNENSWDSSNVEFSSGRIIAYSKRQRTPAMRHIDYGLGVFSASAFEDVASSTPADLATTYQSLLAAGQLAGYEVSQRFYETGSVQGMEDLSAYLKLRERGSPAVNGGRAVFLDRDGVLNRAIIRDGKPYPPRTMEEFALLPGVKASVEDLRRAGFRLIVVTNQPDVARGTQSRDKVEQMHAYLREELAIDDVFVCWHDDHANCDCRKPRPGLLLAAAQKYGINLNDSFMIGDRWRDVEAGHQAGCRSIFIDYGYAERKAAVEPVAASTSLRQAADWILFEQGREV
jgi:N-acetyl-alpha-D-muramate 1-phosphate uridylyltransferase